METEPRCVRLLLTDPLSVTPVGTTLVRCTLPCSANLSCRVGMKNFSISIGIVPLAHLARMADVIDSDSSDSDSSEKVFSFVRQPSGNHVELQAELVHKEEALEQWESSVAWWPLPLRPFFFRAMLTPEHTAVSGRGSYSRGAASVDWVALLKGLATTIGFVISFFVCKQVALSFTGSLSIPGVTGYHPASGLALVLALGYGPAALPLLFVTEWLWSGQWAWSLVAASMHVLEARLVRWADPHVTLGSPHKVVRFALVLSVTRVALAAFLCVMHLLEGKDLPSQVGLLEFLLSDVNGILSFGTFLIETRRFVMRLLSGTRPKTDSWATKAIVLLLSSAFALWAAFCWPSSPGSGPRMYLILLPVIAAALMFGLIGVTWWYLVISTVSGIIFMAVPEAYGPVPMVELQFAYTVVVVTGLLLGAEQERAHKYVVLTNHARDEAERLKNSRNRLLQAVSHEIKTPLHGISGMLEVLSHSKSLSPRHAKCVETARHSCLVLSSIVTDVLALRRLEETGDFPIVSELFSVRDLCMLLDDAVDLFLVSSQEQQVRLVGSYSAAMWMDVRLCYNADLVRLRQVLTNLVSNALKNTTRGSVCVSLSPPTLDGLFSIEVRDTGCGMTEEQVARLCQPFEQMNIVKDEHHLQGTGLGLFISKQILVAMGGQLFCTSKVGKGTCFTILVPAARSVEMCAESLPHVATRYHLVEVATQDAFFEDQVRSVAEQCLNVDKVTDGELRKRAVIVDCTQEVPAELLRASAILLVLSLQQPPPSPLALQVFKSDAVVRVAFAPLHPSSIVSFLLQPESLLPIDTLSSREGFAVPRGLEGDELIAWRRQQGSGGQTARNLSDEMPGSKTRPHLRSGKILIVDDIAVNRKVAERLMNVVLPGRSYVFADNGFDAVSKFEIIKDDVSLILMDLMMPLMGGLEATAAIRKMENALGLKHVRIIAVSAADQDLQRRAVEAGCDTVLNKPFTSAALAEVLQRDMPTAKQ